MSETSQGNSQHPHDDESSWHAWDADALLVDGETIEAESDQSLLSDLEQLAGTIVPDSAFAEELEVRLRTHGQHLFATSQGSTYVPGVTTLPLRRAARPRTLYNQGLSSLALAVLVLVMAVMLTPSVQAGVREALRLGAVRIGWNQPTAAPPGTPTPTLIPSLLNLTGQTTLAQAQARTSFPIRLPSYPPNLGTPQYVFLQDLDGAAVMLVWIDQTHPNRAMLGLNELSSDAYVYKIAPQVVQQTAVHGQRALWTTGPYLLQIGPVAEQHNTLRRLVTASHTLIWAEGDVTYRLETDLTLTDAVHIAESLQR